MAVIAPSYSTPFSVVKVKGLKLLHKIFSDILVAINNDIPLPIPYPLDNISSNNITIKPAKLNWIINKILFFTPINSTSPYIPL